MRKYLLMACLALVPLPLLAQSLPPGTVAIYSDGRVEKLLQVKSASSIWQDGRKRLREYANNPILQLLSYTQFPAYEGYSQQVSLGAPEQIMPYGDADAVLFTLKRNFFQGGNSLRYWRCQYEGKGQFELDKRQLLTEKYSCERSVPHVKTMMSQFRESVVLQYAPALSLVVDQIRTTRDTQSRRQLVTLLAPEQVTAASIVETVKRLHRDQ